VKYIPDSRVPLDKILKREVHLKFSSSFSSEIVLAVKQPIQAPSKRRLPTLICIWFS
jgi:hypothetical protein